MSHPSIPDKLFFRIGEVGRIVGVENHVLRYWESEFRMRPQRSSSGHRMYRRRDVEKFLRIQQLVHERGFTIQGARKALSEGVEPMAEGVDPDRVAEALIQLSKVQRQIRTLRRDLLVPSLPDLPASR
ncbi:MAG: MerR family transcriptional regulator [Deltaproteobacteria bacterium]|nr:MAG: MerR family transcriptional regulator [Deltaproteobacteria bacterium]